MPAMMPVPSHPARQFVARQQAVIVGIHAREHGDKAPAEFVRRDHAVAIGVQAIKARPVVRQKLVLCQRAVAVSVKHGGAEDCPRLW